MLLENRRSDRVKKRRNKLNVECVWPLMLNCNLGNFENDLLLWFDWINVDTNAFTFSYTQMSLCSWSNRNHVWYGNVDSIIWRRVTNCLAISGQLFFRAFCCLHCRWFTELGHRHWCPPAMVMRKRMVLIGDKVLIGKDYGDYMNIM